MSWSEKQDYTCTLSERSLKVAQDELNEDPKERMSQVETLRTWIRQQKHLTAMTDTDNLLRFLRTAKFSQLRAREMLQGFLRQKTLFPNWMTDLDPAEPDIVSFLKTGYFLPLPKVDPRGRKIIMLRISVLDTDDKRLTKDKVIRAVFAGVLYIMLNENEFVNGSVYIQDFSGFTPKVMTFFGVETMKNSMRIWQGNIPARYKALYYYNTGPFFETIMTILKPVMSKKLQERITVLGKNLEELYKALPMEYLPAEYLPDDYDGPHQGSIQDVIDGFVSDITTPESRERIKHMSSSQWRYDGNLKDDGIPNESFRKLNVE